MTSPTNKAHSGRGPFAVLRRAKNVKNASEGERHALNEDAERIENRCACIVLAAVGLEFVTWVLPLCPLLFRAGNAISDGAIAIGIYGEMRFGEVAGNILKIMLVEAVERVSKAERELIRRGPRHIDTDKFASELKDVGTTLPVEIFFLEHNHEAYVLALEIRAALAASNWVVSDFLPKSPAQLGRCIPNPPVISDAPPTGALSITQRIETAHEMLTFHAAHMGIPTQKQFRIPVNALGQAIVGSMRGGGWTVVAHPIDPSITDIDAPPSGVLRVLIGPRG